MILSRVALAKISAPPAGHGVQARLLQLAQHLLHAHAVELVEEEDLHRGEGLDVDVGPGLLDAAHHVREVRPRQVGVQPAHDVDLAHGPR